MTGGSDMAFDLKNAYNKYAKFGTSFNRGINKLVGKDVLQDVKEIEAPRDFLPYTEFAKYSVEEPAQWTALTGESRVFSLEGSSLNVSSSLDVCMKYRKLFQTTARYYADRFKFNYHNCVQDFDTLVHYFEEMYLEGLTPMIYRAYSILLSLGVVSADIETFTLRQIATYKRASTSWEIMVGIETSRNQAAQNAGNVVGNSVQMQGGGFGFKGAMKGMAKAELFNFGMGALGKITEIQNRMSQEDKAKVYAEFKQDLFFEEVYSDYVNTFLTMIEILSENNELTNVHTITGNDFTVMVRNLQNPMFPQDKVVSALINLIATYPFEPTCYELLKQKIGETAEVNEIINYFVG